MIITLAPWALTLWRRSWFVVFLGLIIARAYAQVPAGAWTVEKLLGAGVALAIFTTVLWILDNNARAFETNKKAFARILISDQERLERMIALRLATESLAATLDVIRRELARNTAVTHAGAEAASCAVTLAETVAEKLGVLTNGTHHQTSTDESGS